MMVAVKKGAFATRSKTVDFSGFSIVRLRLWAAFLGALLVFAYTSELGAQVKTGVVKIVSRPSGATVFIAGKTYGPTPVLIELPSGKHSATISLEGYPPITRSIDVVQGRMGFAKVSFTRGPGPGIRVHNTRNGGEDSGPGTINIATQPTGLTVFMNDLIVPQPTPVSFDIRAGIYELTLEKNGEVVYRKTIFIRAGRTVHLDVTVRRKRKIDDSDPWK